MRTALALVIALVACKAKSKDDGQAGPCLELPNAPRRALQADPAGGGLYWIERVIAHDYDGIDISFERLVRFDLKTKELAVIADRVTGPLHFAKDGSLLAVAKHDKTGMLLHIRDGHVQNLVPTWFDVRDFEPIDGRRFAVAAGADSKWSIFTIDLDRPRPAHLVDGDVLMSATRDALFVRDGVAEYSVDVATGATTPIDIPNGMPDRERMYVVEESLVKARVLGGDGVGTLVHEPRAWTLLHQHGSVLARAGDPKVGQYTVVLANGLATPLPLIEGGTSIVNTTQLADDTWALVGHNTSNYDGDLQTTTHEADVCKLDTRRDHLRFETRTLPARYAAKSVPFWAAAAKIPGSKWQLLDIVGDVPTVYLELDEDGGEDLEKMRDRARSVHKSVTSVLDDDELQTSLTYNDGRIAFHRWRRDRLRGRTFAGTGDIPLTDPADFDIELTDLVNEKTVDEVICSGQITNLRTVTLLHIQVRCLAGDQGRVIAVPKLEPKQTFKFSETYALQENDNPILEVFRGREQLLVRDMALERKNRALYDFFVKLQSDTKLGLRERNLVDRFRVVLERHGTSWDDIDLAAVKQAYERIDSIGRTLHGIEKDVDLELQIYANRQYHAWDGTQLSPVN